MKTYYLLFVLAVAMLAPAAAAEEAELSPQKQMEIRNLQLDLEEREMEMDFQRRFPRKWGYPRSIRRCELGGQYVSDKNAWATAYIR